MVGRLAEGRRERGGAQTRGMGKRISQASQDQKNWDRHLLPPRRDSPDFINIPEAIFPPTGLPSLPLSVAGLWGTMPAGLRSCSGGPAVSPWTEPSPLRDSALLSLICATGLTKPLPELLGGKPGAGGGGKKALSRGERLYFFIVAVWPSVLPTPSRLLELLNPLILQPQWALS